MLQRDEKCSAENELLDRVWTPYQNGFWIEHQDKANILVSKTYTLILQAGESYYLRPLQYNVKKGVS